MIKDLLSISIIDLNPESLFRSSFLLKNLRSVIEISCYKSIPTNIYNNIPTLFCLFTPLCYKDIKLKYHGIISISKYLQSETTDPTQIRVFHCKYILHVPSLNCYTWSKSQCLQNSCVFVTYLPTFKSKLLYNQSRGQEWYV